MPPSVIYLDHNATTPLDPRVLERMQPYFTERFGNPSSRTHAYGFEAEEAVEEARLAIAQVLEADPREILFTSGATEANNLVIQGTAARFGGGRLVTQATEHPSVLEPMRQAAREGFELVVLPVDKSGQVDPARLEAALDQETRLVSIMAANNEVGTLQPLAALGAICQRRGVPLHVDAAQAAGRVPLAVHALGISFLTLSGHKIYGPKGVGALYRARGQKLEPLLLGGGQEEGLRGGTLNVPGIVGLGCALKLMAAEAPAENARLRQMRSDFFARLCEALPGLRQNGHPEERLAGNLNFQVEGLDAGGLILSLKGLALSPGSACGSARQEASHVLLALGLSRIQAKSCIRVGLGRWTSQEELDQAASLLIQEIRHFRQLGHSSRRRIQRRPPRPASRK